MCLIGRSESYLTLRNREDMGALSGECSFIGQRHYTGLSGEIHGRYGHGTDAYPRENCIAPDVGCGSAAQGGAGSSPAVELGPTREVAQLNTRVEGEVAQLGRKIGILVVGHGLGGRLSRSRVPGGLQPGG